MYWHSNGKYNIHVADRKTKFYKSELLESALLSRGRDSRLMERDREVSVRELAVQLNQFLVRSFIPILGWTPQIPELLPDARGLIEGKILVNGTPCAVQSTSNPAIEKFELEAHCRG